MLANDCVFIERQREGNVLVGKLDDMILLKLVFMMSIERIKILCE